MSNLRKRKSDNDSNNDEEGRSFKRRTSTRSTSSSTVNNTVLIDDEIDITNTSNKNRNKNIKINSHQDIDSDVSTHLDEDEEQRRIEDDDDDYGNDVEEVVWSGEWEDSDEFWEPSFVRTHLGQQSQGGNTIVLSDSDEPGSPEVQFLGSSNSHPIIISDTLPSTSSSSSSSTIPQPTSISSSSSSSRSSSSASSLPSLSSSSSVSSSTSRGFSDVSYHVMPGTAIQFPHHSMGVHFFHTALLEAVQQQLNINLDALAAAAQHENSHHNRGIPERVRRSLKKEKLKTNSQETCCICLDEMGEGNYIKRLRCSHFFHCKCIDIWLKQSSVCPLCKTSLTSL